MISYLPKTFSNKFIKDILITKKVKIDNWDDSLECEEIFKKFDCKSHVLSYLLSLEPSKDISKHLYWLLKNNCIKTNDILPVVERKMNLEVAFDLYYDGFASKDWLEKIIQKKNKKNKTPPKI